MTRSLFPAALLALPLATAAPADETVFDDHIVIGNQCVGPDCATDDEFGFSTAIFKDPLIRLQFNDTSALAPANDWRFLFNDPSGVGAQSYFRLEDSTAGTTPFTIMAGAPSTAFHMNAAGRVGLGTTLPQNTLHIADEGSVTFRLEETTAPYSYTFNANDFGFWIRDRTADTVPFVIQATSPNNSLWVADDGYIGLGTSVPAAPLELWSDETFNFFRLSASGAAINQSVDITFTGGPLGTGELRYNIVDGDGPEMKLNANGDMELEGTLTTAGSCSVGCDAVFDADYPLPSIEDHHAQTLALGHLPNVGPTRPGEPWDVTDKMGRILNELEHAHLFIAGQQEEIRRQQQELAAQRAELAETGAALSETRAALAALTARLAALETSRQAD